MAAYFPSESAPFHLAFGAAHNTPTGTRCLAALRYLCSPSVMRLLASLIRHAHKVSRQGPACALLLISSLLLACGRAPAPSPEDAFREIDPPQLADDLNLHGLTLALDAQRSVLLAHPERTMRVGHLTISHARYVAALDGLSVIARTTNSTEAVLSYIRENFRFFELYGDKDWGEVLLTGYFEPELRGSSRPTPTYSQPLYGRPNDLVTVQLSSFAERFKDERSLKGRIDGQKITPYYSRAQIDGEKALSERGLELCWVDPIDAFFLQIQGSGTIILEDGKQLTLNYSEKNGLAYVPVGKFLKERIAPRKVTMQSVERELRAMAPHERDEILFQNPSYVFFTPSSRRAVTSLGVPATAGRTIAADATYAPKGALAFLTFEKPVLGRDSDGTTVATGSVPVGRFVVDQDSGGAITGTGRIDLFFGSGSDAREGAGVLQSRGRVVYLVPRLQ